MKNLVLLTFRRATLIILCSAIITGSIAAQETGSCAEKLKSAQTAFARGQTEQIPELLNNCLRNKGFKKEEELAAFKLLIQTYLLNDKPAQADSTMLAFLKRNPEYKASPTDHSSFVYLYNNYDVKSLLMVSMRIGTNVPFLTFVNDNLLSGAPGISKYSSNAGNLFFSLEAKYKLSERIEVGLGAGFSQMRFTNNIVFNDDVILPNFSHITYTESQNRIEVPVYMTYDLIQTSKFIPYVRVGGGAAFNLSTTADASLVNDQGSKQGNRTGETLDRKDSRVKIDFFGSAGAGLKYKIPRGFLFAEARSNIGLMQQYVSGGSTVDILQNKYMWADPGFRLNSFNMNMGITVIFYKPSKKAETK